MTATGHKWKPIEDIQDPTSLTDGELTPLLEVWKEQRTALPNNGEDSEFSKRLAREWAIETGIVEGAYTLDRGTTETLIEKGIDVSLIVHEPGNPDSEVLTAILNDHLEALEHCFAFVKSDRQLSTSFINGLHSALMKHQDTYVVRDQFGNLSSRELPKGVYKTQPNNPTRPDQSVHEYCPPEHTASEMDRLIQLFQEHIQKGITAEAGAAWLHHAFTQIHPFADGNGRVARILASIVFIKNGGFPLLITRYNRSRYIEALEGADQGDLRPLIKLFVTTQRRAVMGALQALPITSSIQTQEPHTPEEIIGGIRDLLVSRGDAIPKTWEATLSIGANLQVVMVNRLERIRVALANEIQRANPKFQFSLGSSNQLSAPEAEEVKRQGYTINPMWKSAQILTLNSGQTSHLQISLHTTGSRYRGILAGMILFVRADSSVVSVTDDIFQANYKDSPPDALRRFNAWLEDGLTRALTLWREQL